MPTTTVVNGVVESVAASGKGIKVNGTWYNRGKGAQFPTFLGLVNKGDMVELEVSDNKWVTKTPAVNGSAPAQTATTGAKTTTATAGTKDISIARQASIKAVLGSPLIANMLRDKNEDEAMGAAKDLIKQMTNYAVNGDFIVADPTETI